MRLQASVLSLALAYGGAAWCDASDGTSGIAQQARHIFSSMVNVTAPTAHLGQRRGVFDGGSLVARNRIVNEALWHLVPPSFEAGCGGIDLFAGSFSFISADQFQQLMRSIAANATGYAFEVALSAMCPTCMEVMEALQKKIQALNQGYLNSCQLAKGLVNDVADAFHAKHDDQTSLVGMVKGFGDVFETRSTTTGKNPVEQAADNMTEPERIAANLQGNLVWKALVRANTASWFTGGDDHLLEAIMSVTGSVIVGPPQLAPDGQGESFDVRPLAGGILSVTDLMWGNNQWEAGDERNNPFHTVRKYDCQGDYDACLAPVIGNDAGPIGLVQLTRNLLLGDPRDAQAVGLVDKLRLGDVGLTPAERAFLEHVNVGIGASMRTLARHGHGLARNFAEQAAPIIAFEMVQTIMNDLLRTASEAMTLNSNAYTKQVIDQIAAAKEQVGHDYQLISARYGNAQTLLAHYTDLAEQVRAPAGAQGAGAQGRGAVQ